MILSVGVDLVEVQRIQRALEDSRIGKRFRERVFTAGEIDYCEKKGRGRYESYAGRFAAKEAVMKALGRGWGSKVRWLDIEVARASSMASLMLLLRPSRSGIRAAGRDPSGNHANIERMTRFRDIWFFLPVIRIMSPRPKSQKASPRPSKEIFAVHSARR